MARCDPIEDGFLVFVNTLHFYRLLSLSAWLLAAGALAPGRVRACSVCGCSMNSDWSSQGYTVSSGVRLDVRFDDSDQTQLRSGTHPADRGDFAFPNDQEIQQETLNRVATLGVDFSPSRDWGLNFQLPEIDRFHTTIAAGDAAISTARLR